VRETPYQCLTQELARAQQRADLVTIKRAIEGADAVTGYVVGVGSHWVLVNVLEAGDTNGWIAVARSDIRLVETAAGASFVRRGLEHRRSWPPAAPDVDLELSGIGVLLASAAAAFSILTFYAERADPTRCHIGHPSGLTPDELVWQELTPTASWAEEASLWPLSVITRVDLGGQYERALAHASYLRSLSASTTPQLPGYGSDNPPSEDDEVKEPPSRSPWNTEFRLRLLSDEKAGA